MFWRKKLKEVPREVNAEFEGWNVQRIQFSPGGGFKVTAKQNDKEIVWWVPNDPGNRHCQFVRKWMCQGGFPEDPDPLIAPKFLGMKHHTWALLGKVVVVIGTGLAGIAGILAIMK